MSDEEPPVLDWSRVIHKNVRSADGVAAGNIAAEKGDKIFIQSAGGEVHAVIPKTLVKSFNGAEVMLKKPWADLGDYILSKEEPLINWDGIINKNIVSSDGKAVGNVAAIKGKEVVIKSTTGSQGYDVIPKTMVDRVNGNEVVLKKRMADVSDYMRHQD